MPAAVDGAPGEDLVRHDPIAAMDKPLIYDQTDARKLAAFKAKCRGLSDVQVGMALEMIASLGLNPWANEVYAANNNGQLLIMVGRDGLLRKAEEFPDYAGYDCGVVYEGDEFFKGEPDPDGKTLRQRAGVTHRQGVPKPGARILGAWAVAERKGRPPRYFFARWEEYVPNMPADKLAKSPWGKNKSVMIEKVAISVVHRTTCNLSGVYLPEEVESTLNPDGNRPVGREEEQGAIAALVEGLDAPEELKDALLTAIAELNSLCPGSWGLAKAQMVLTGRDAEELGRELEQVRKDIAKERERIEAAAAEEDAITDADVVPEGPAPEEDPAAVAEREQLEHQRADLVSGLEAPDLDMGQRDQLLKELEQVETRLEELGA